MPFFMLFEGNLVNMWHIAYILDSGYPTDRPDPADPTESDQPDRPTLLKAAPTGRVITLNFAPPDW